MDTSKHKRIELMMFSGLICISAAWMEMAYANPILKDRVQTGMIKQNHVSPKKIGPTVGRQRLTPSSPTQQPGTGYASCTPPARGLATPKRLISSGKADASGHVRVTSNLVFSSSPYPVDSDIFISGKNRNGGRTGGDCGYIYCLHPADRFRLYNVTGGGKKMVASSLRAQISGTATDITLPPRLTPGEYKIGLVQGRCFQRPSLTSPFQQRGYRDTGALLTGNSFRIASTRKALPSRAEVLQPKAGIANRRIHGGFVPKARIITKPVPASRVGVTPHPPVAPVPGGG